MDLTTVPETAISAYEALARCRVVVHDLVGWFGAFLPPTRFHHGQPACAAVKNSPYGRHCLAFEITSLRSELARWRQGRIHRCHAGFIEWMVPVWHDEQPAAVLFGGQRTPGPTLVADVVGSAIGSKARIGSSRMPKPPIIEADEAAVVLEGLRQVAARLSLWLREAAPLVGIRDRTRPRGDLPRRDVAIRSFIHHRHAEPIRLSDLAAHLGLSEDRASHAVKETCKVGFAELLVQARIRTAASLLRHTDLPVSEVALRSGFGDLSHFHRSFRLQVGLSPARYRRASEMAP